MPIVPQMPMPPGGGQPAPQQAPQGSGRPELVSILISGLQGNQSESVTLTYADGFKAVETVPELLHMGFPPQMAQQVVQAFQAMGDVVYRVNRGGGMPR